MSCYHHFYSLRLTRAYLGAANPNRTGLARRHCDEVLSGTAEPDRGDQVQSQHYHANIAAPIDFINAMLAWTVDASVPLVQRDRKGRPLTVLPCLDGRAGVTYVSIGERLHEVRENGARLSIGDWLAIRSAAVSTGMGRQTSTAAAVCARIGRRWPSGLGKDG